MGLTDIDSFSRIKKIVSEDGEEHIIALETIIRNRKFIITTTKKIFEVISEGKYIDCTNLKDDKEVEFLKKYTAPPVSQDIIW